jgi:YHS domain-containing protein
MFKKIFMGISALMLVGAGYTAVIAADGPAADEVGVGCPGCKSTESEKTVVTADAAATAPAAEKVDVKNTKCLVMKGDDVEDSKETVEYQGKVYHLCCSKCAKKFNKDPEKYVKAFEADPAAYGVKK